MELFYKFSRSNMVLLCTDFLLLVFSYVISYFLRFYPILTDNLNLLLNEMLGIQIALYISIFYVIRIYQIIWAYSNIKDMYKLLIANVVAFLTFTVYIWFFNKPYSRMMYLIDFFFICTGSIFVRVLFRDYVFHYKKKNYTTDQILKKIIIIGAGEAGRSILNELTKSGRDKEVVGFLDDDSQKTKKYFNGKMVLGASSDINKIVTEKGIDEILIAMPSTNAEIINAIVSPIKREFKHIPIRILPPLIEIISNRPLLQSLHDISISDLIGREEIKVNNALIEDRFKNKTILITGAGGSIGSELCKQISKYRIKRLICLGHGENSLFNLNRMLDENMLYITEKPDINYKIVDIKDAFLLDTIFSQYKPDVVFHAAAHKHVPLMESNELEAIQNNVFGTLNVMEVCSKHSVDQFVLISTDKAVNPANIMGATKRLTELLTMYWNETRHLNTTIVRFGNVIGSRGSVIPVFMDQIKNGGPITITHPDIERYFMTIPEASLLVINAASLSKGQDVFVLDMGKSHKIVDIAKNLILLAGLVPEKDIQIKFIGLRPGEKMYEELFYDKDSVEKTENEKILRSKIFALSDKQKEFIEQAIINKQASFEANNPKQIRELIKSIIPEYDYKLGSGN